MMSSWWEHDVVMAGACQQAGTGAAAEISHLSHKDDEDS